MDLFHGKLVVVTGASAGIGAEFARQLYHRGANLILIARRRERLESLKHELQDGGNRIEIMPADLTNSEDLAHCATILGERDVDILINNAGKGSFGRFDELPIEQELELVALNIIAGLRLVAAVLPSLKQKGSGGLITVASIAGMQPLPYMATYSGTKAFDLFHSLALYQELKPFGVRSLAVCPGPVATEFAGVARVPGEWTDVRRDEVGPVVRESLVAYERRKPLVVPGTRSKGMALACAVLPTRVGLFFVERSLRASLS